MLKILFTTIKMWLSQKGDIKKCYKCAKLEHHKF